MQCELQDVIEDIESLQSELQDVIEDIESLQVGTLDRRVNKKQKLRAAGKHLKALCVYLFAKNGHPQPNKRRALPLQGRM